MDELTTWGPWESALQQKKGEVNASPNPIPGVTRMADKNQEDSAKRPATSALAKTDPFALE